MKGAPIRFAVAVIGGWTCVRIAVLLPDAAPLTLARDVLATPAQAVGRASLGWSAQPFERRAVGSPVSVIVRNAARPQLMWRTARAVEAKAPLSLRIEPLREPIRETVAPMLIPATLGPARDGETPRRWSASTWLLARGGADGTLSGGQLGASQAGARLLYRISAARRLSLAARVATPLRGRGAEAAFGVDWQPTTAPVHLVAEQRIGLDGARGGPTAMVIGGLNPMPITAGFRFEAYAQTGAILRGNRVEAFGDGALRLTRSVATVGRTTLDVGLGAWAAGQRGAARADVGPTIAVALPVGGRSVRLSLDWRQRIAGRARPGSGPALSIGSDF